ncbi:MAG: hypothetical protein JO013_15325 [Alphaproteobacteria bacterium]|nr:hypothetical protein [Alphaproteobacteria bacterium]
MASDEAIQDGSTLIDFARLWMEGAGEPSLAAQFGTETKKQDPDQASSGFCNFWQAGCVFDTILDYFLTLEEAGRFTPADAALRQQLVGQAITGYRNGIIGVNANWYDDWCWWGIAAAKAFDPDYEDGFGTDADAFRAMALDLWGLVDQGDFGPVAQSVPDWAWKKSAFLYDDTKRVAKFTRETLTRRAELHVGTRNAWSLITDGPHGIPTDRTLSDRSYFTSPVPTVWAEPRFPGGCWQYDLSTWPFPVGDGPDWKDPNPRSCTLGVFQVTLMQGLYLSLCCALLTAARRKAAEKLSGGAWDALLAEEAYRQSADEVVGFLAAWLGLPGADSLGCSQVDQKPIEGMLVHERPRTYARLRGTDLYPEIESYQADSFWAGDQGLIMGALMQYRLVVGDGGRDAGEGGAAPIWTTCPEALLKGVCHAMGGTSPAGDYRPVKPFMPDAPPFSGDPGDYEAGSGVFWRYVMRCCRADPAFRTQAQADPVIVGVAGVSGTTPDDSGNNLLFQPFNNVAAAIGAWHLLR